MAWLNPNYIGRAAYAGSSVNRPAGGSAPLAGTGRCQPQQQQQQAAHQRTASQPAQQPAQQRPDSRGRVVGSGHGGSQHSNNQMGGGQPPPSTSGVRYASNVFGARDGPNGNIAKVKPQFSPARGSDDIMSSPDRPRFLAGRNGSSPYYPTNGYQQGGAPAALPKPAGAAVPLAQLGMQQSAARGGMTLMNCPKPESHGCKVGPQTGKGVDLISSKFSRKLDATIQVCQENWSDCSSRQRQDFQVGQDCSLLSWNDQNTTERIFSGCCLKFANDHERSLKGVGEDLSTVEKMVKDFLTGAMKIFGFQTVHVVMVLIYLESLGPTWLLHGQAMKKEGSEEVYPADWKRTLLLLLKLADDVHPVDDDKGLRAVEFCNHLRRVLPDCKLTPNDVDTLTFDLFKKMEFKLSVRCTTRFQAFSEQLINAQTKKEVQKIQIRGGGGRKAGVGSLSPTPNGLRGSRSDTTVDTLSRQQIAAQNETTNGEERGALSNRMPIVSGASKPTATRATLAHVGDKSAGAQPIVPAAKKAQPAPPGDRGRERPQPITREEPEQPQPKPMLCQPPAARAGMQQTTSSRQNIGAGAVRPPGSQVVGITPRDATGVVTGRSTQRAATAPGQSEPTSHGIPRGGAAGSTPPQNYPFSRNAGATPPKTNDPRPARSGSAAAGGYMMNRPIHSALDGNSGKVDNTPRTLYATSQGQTANRPAPALRAQPGMAPPKAQPGGQASTRINVSRPRNGYQ